MNSSTIDLNVDTMGMAMFSDSKAASTSGKSIGNTTSTDGVTRYRILMLSEGIHNGLRVLRNDINQMIVDVLANPNAVIPVVLDHSFNWNDIVGKITNVEYHDTYVMPDGTKVTGAALADIELLPPSDNTPKLNESLYRMEKLPELAKFSVAFKFTPITDNVGNTTVKELGLKHVAIVTNPADASTGIIEKFSRRNIATNDVCRIDMTGAFERGNTMPKTTRFSSQRPARRGARFNNPAIDAVARNALPRTGTYPIRDVSSIIMRPGQLSPLACGCGDELYEYQSRVNQYDDDARAEAGFSGRRARFAKARKAARLAANRKARKAAKFAARSNRPSARFSTRRGARFSEPTVYGVPTVYGNPWDYPISDTYPNVNQLISLKRRAARLAARRSAAARLARSGARPARFARRGARFNEDYPTYDDGTPVVIQDGGYIDEYPEYQMQPVYDDASVGNVSALEPGLPILDAPVTQAVDEPDALFDPIIDAYVQAGLINPDEIVIVEETLARCRSQMGRKAARFGRKAGSKKYGKLSARKAPRAKFAGRRAKFDAGGLVNDYLVPSANLPRNQNINIAADSAREAEFAKKRAARFGSKSNRRSGSFFASRGVEKASKLNQQVQAPVPVQNTSIAPANAANTAPQTFVGENTKKILEELAETKAALASSEQLSMLRSQALAMQFADKELIMSFNEDQLKRYIQTNGITTANFAASPNPFVSQGANASATAKYIAEFADSFTKGSVTPCVATMDQIQASALQKASQLFGDD